MDVARISRAMGRFQNRFLQRIFTAQELTDCCGRTTSLAARWAGKEAVSKALGTGFDGFNWTDIEIVVTALGKPQVALHGKALEQAQQLGLVSWEISLSHTSTYAVAFVMAQAKQEEA